MPNAAHPVAKEWGTGLARAVGRPSTRTYLVGHSLGCMTILRYLESLPAGQKVGAVILVAGFGERFKGYQGQHDSFFDHDLDWRAIRTHCAAFIAIHSRDDPLVGLDQQDLFKQKLSAVCVEVDGMGHFGSDDGVFELPLVRDRLLAIDQE